MHVRITGKPLHIAERLLHRLPERDSDVLGGVMLINVQVALGLDGKVNAGMTRQQLEHVIEKTNPGRNRRCAGTVKVDDDLHVGLLGTAPDRGLAHELSLSY